VFVCLFVCLFVILFNICCDQNIIWKKPTMKQSHDTFINILCICLFFTLFVCSYQPVLLLFYCYFCLFVNNNVMLKSKWNNTFIWNDRWARQTRYDMTTRFFNVVIVQRSFNSSSSLLPLYFSSSFHTCTDVVFRFFYFPFISRLLKPTIPVDIQSGVDNMFSSHMIDNNMTIHTYKQRMLLSQKYFYSNHQLSVSYIQ